MRKFFVIVFFALCSMAVSAKEHRAPAFYALLNQVDAVATQAQQEGRLERSQLHVVLKESDILRLKVQAPMEEDLAHLVAIKRIFTTADITVVQLNDTAVQVSRLIDELDSSFVHVIRDQETQSSSWTFWVSMTILLGTGLWYGARVRTPHPSSVG
jgi:hypothetical protein